MGVPFTFLHAADLHLDSPFKGLTKVPDAVRERLRESTFTALGGLCDIVRREKIDFVVLAGDLFDAADRSLRAQLRLQRTLGEMTALGVQVFIVHGNHDPESGRQAKLDWPQGVHVFGSSGVDCFPAHTRNGDLAAFVYGISYPTAAVTDNLALRFKKREGAPFHLALLHANVDGDPSYDNYAPCKLEELTSAGFHYWALGHVHDRRILHEYPHVVYPGNLQGRSIRETGGKGAYIVSVSDTGSIDMRFRDVADVLWQEIAVSIEGIEREQELKNRLGSAVEEVRQAAQGRPVLARIRLAGRGVLHDKLIQPSVAEEWLEELREWVGAPEDSEGWIWPESISVRTGGVLRLENAAEEEGFLGELLRRGLAAAHSPELSKDLLDEAMETLRRQPKIREWLETRTHEERIEWINQAMELSVSLLREEDAG
ncbi:metallophosphoesterase family protein [Cohnella silvisoli]|uniref:DNA repair exonuclease n=1 Tax=Cohnella silvisoli TaxID=2873699 RepID=A0ABV1KP87_9BACL|nr:DNA repair exonuclease [Cohnella silvisoli]MCD9025606.1 DNA repair exonuclease [Cohnella silvisoli]